MNPGNEARSVCCSKSAVLCALTLKPTPEHCLQALTEGYQMVMAVSDGLGGALQSVQHACRTEEKVFENQRLQWNLNFISYY